MKKKILLIIGITMFAHNAELFRPLTYRATNQKKPALLEKRRLVSKMERGPLKIMNQNSEGIRKRYSNH